MASRSERPTALVTGARGFTGRYMVQRLEQAGYRVVGLAHEEGPGVVGCDLLDRERLHSVVAEAAPDVVVHLAAIAFVAHGDVDAIYRTNVVGTRHLLEALAALPSVPRAVLLASSANVYGNAAVDPIDESVPPAPANDYAVSKVAMEHMARLWMDQLPIVIARPFNYTGVGQADHFLLPKIVKHFREGKKEIELGNLDVARDFSDVRAVVDAYSRLLESAPSAEAINICSGVATPLEEVIRLMSEIAGYTIDVKVNPAFVRKNEVKSLRGSNAKLIDTIGEMEVIPLKNTLRLMYETTS